MGPVQRPVSSFIPFSVLCWLAFSFLDWLISSVRHCVTYWIFTFYAWTKVASGTAMTMTTFDQEILTLVISFWFGQRLRARALKGGSNA